MMLRAMTVLVCSGLSPAQQALQQAEQAYRQRQYEAAWNGFTAALSETGNPSGALLYDLGNCAFRLGRHAQAVWYYRRALLRLPRDAEVRFNLGLAEQRLGVDAAPDESLAADLGELRDLVTPHELWLLAIALQSVGALGWVLVRHRRAPRNLMIAVSALGVVCWGRLAWLQWFPQPPAAVVLEHGAALREHADAMGRASSQLEPGQVVHVLAVEGPWLRVSHPRGTGWTEAANVGIVD